MGSELTSLEQLPDLTRQAAQIQTLCLHGNRIASLQGLQKLQSLKDLNASSNELQDAHSLRALTALTSVNLASNRLQNLEGLHELPKLERLILAHNNIAALSHFAEQAACRHSLKHLDLQNNQLTSLQELSALKSFPNLQHLKVGSAHSRNPACNRPDYQHLILHMLPQLELLDGQPCDTIRVRQWPVLEPQQQLRYLPAFHQHLQQQQQHLQQQQLQPGPVSLSTDAMVHSHQPLALPAPAPPQQLRPALPAANPASMQSKAPQPLILDASQTQSQDHRIAALESRLREVVSMRSRPPLAPTENVMHQPLAVRKVRPKAVVHEVACQTATSMAQLDRLHHDAAHLKQELQSLASELDNRTSHALRVEEQAEALLQEVEQHADQKVSLLVLRVEPLSHNLCSLPFSRHTVLHLACPAAVHVSTEHHIVMPMLQVPSSNSAKQVQCTLI